MSTDPNVWITIDNRKIPIERMSTKHLENTIRFLRKRALPMRLQLLKRMSRYIADAPNGAAQACDAEADTIIEMSDDEFLSVYVPQWKPLVREVARRQEASR